eukprot:TRINITY_DN7902_c0_g1_i6.p6 TRINITY_DN7902_c0_g1~~TRINITY_DN7902_c0_g1_i6.p6  ORF type:complete len:153 (-),score=31.35 TRINITY_DN7902_c0_g1_i6:109-567(-)
MSLSGTQYVISKSAEYPILRPVCVVLKRLLKARGLNRPFTGGMGSFVLTVMAIAFLRLGNAYASPSKCLAAFLSYYASVFNPKTMAIVDGRITYTYGNENERLLISNPLQQKINIAYNVTRFEEIRKCFLDVHAKITKGDCKTTLDDLLEKQ